MDIKAKISELVDKIKSDDGLAEKFKSNPAETVKDLIGVDLPLDQLEPIVDGIKAKISLDSLGSLGSKLGGLFGR